MKSLTRLISLLLLALTLTAVPAQAADKNNACSTSLTNDEQRLYELIMDYRKSMGLPAILVSPSLTYVAQTHVRDLQAHPPSGACNMHSWSSYGNWSACCYTPDHAQAKYMWNKPGELTGYQGYGFEISYGGSSNATPAGALSGWQGSSGHNAVITNTDIWKSHPWKAIGIGIYGSYAVVWFGEEPDDCSSDKNSTSANTEIHTAAEAGDKAKIEKLLKKGVDVNARDKNGETPLYNAATNGHIEVVELLLSKGADINAKDNDGITALHLSAWNDNSEMIAVLITKGADVNIKQNDGNTPLHNAAYNNSKNAIKLLLLNGADINAKNNEGQTPAMLTDDAETKQMLTKAKTSAEKSVDKAKTAYQNGDYDNAIKYATRAIDNNEGWMSYLVRGWSYRATGEYQKAVDDFNVVIDNTSNPDSVVAFALSDRGLVYITYGTTLFDSDKDKGVSLIKQGVSDYREAIAKDNTAITPAYRFADFSIVLKQYQEARDVLDNLIAHNPDAKDDADIKALQAEINKNL